MNVPVKRTAAGQSLWAVYQRLTQAEWALVHVANVPLEEMNRHLVEKVKQAVPKVVLESVWKADVVGNAFAVSIIEHTLKESGIRLSGVPAGYYLIYKAKVTGFHPAMMTQDEMSVGALAGLFAGIGALVTTASGYEALSKGADAACSMMGLGAAERAFNFFEGIINSIRTQTRRGQSKERWKRTWDRQQQASAKAEFTRACTVLGVSAQAEKAAVDRAYREKAKQYHPDRNPGSDGQQMAGLNAAKDLYFSERGWK